MQYVGTNHVCATAYKQTLKFEVFGFMTLNLYIKKKSLPPTLCTMINYATQLPTMNSLCRRHILFSVYLPTIHKINIPKSVSMIYYQNVNLEVKRLFPT